jgi:ADP-ribose pyrophosphatase YjhB (NUDIX family)
MHTPRLQPLTAEEFERIYSKVPRLTVEVILKVDNGVVLTLRTEKSWQGQYHIPGGTVLYQEPLTGAVQRIAQEELGISVKIQQLVGYIEYPSEVLERGFGWSVGIAFLCEPAEEVDLKDWEARNIRVFEALPENLIAEQRPILEKAL